MVSYKEMKNLVQLICPSLTTPSIPISLKLVDRAEVEPWVAEIQALALEFLRGLGQAGQR